MKKKKESWPEQPGESVLHKHAHLHPILRVGYSSDSIQVWPRAECSTSATNNKAFPFRPALQLTDLLLQLHHHAACDDRIRTITCGQLPLQGRSGLTRESIHARGVIDGQHCDARLLPQQINGASRKCLQLLSDLLLVEVVDSGAFSQQQPWRNIYTLYIYVYHLWL